MKEVSRKKSIDNIGLWKTLEEAKPSERKLIGYPP
jgi:hypothetical protein